MEEAAEIIQNKVQLYPGERTLEAKCGRMAVCTAVREGK